MKPPRSVGQVPPLRKRDLMDSWSDDQIRYVMELHAKALSNISFGTTTANTDPDMNMQCWKATGTTPGGANTEFAVTHNLKHVPIGFFVLSTDKAAHIYKSTTAWTAATNSSLGTIYLKCDVATVAFTITIL